jgi:hypothetical protein
LAALFHSPIDHWHHFSPVIGPPDWHRRVSIPDGRAGRRNVDSSEFAHDAAGGSRRDAGKNLALGPGGKASAKKLPPKIGAGLCALLTPTVPRHEAPAPIDHETQPPAAGLACQKAETLKEKGAGLRSRVSSNRRGKEPDGEGEQHEAAESVDRCVYRIGHWKITRNPIV